MASDCLALEKIEWEQAICSVCLDAPHKAVLLLCASHDKGCRPYMCGTSFRHSNCFDLFKKTRAKPAITPSTSLDRPSCKISKLSCPLCRGEVKAWSVVRPARKHLNKKSRNCMQEGCLFTGTYKELNRHVKADHDITKPWKIDPSLESKWKFETSEEDMLSTVRRLMPGAVISGDYVIGMDSYYDHLPMVPPRIRRGDYRAPIRGWDANPYYRIHPDVNPGRGWITNPNPYYGRYPDVNPDTDRTRIHRGRGRAAYPYRGRGRTVCPGIPRGPSYHSGGY